MQRKMMLVRLRGQAQRFVLGLPSDTCENLQQLAEALHKRFLPLKERHFIELSYAVAVGVPMSP